ncbi:hypothetical protein [Edaphobacter aggregans]|uniref:hypothetical protein n=1 Tax=Edaphobacter aggregans TaxID=570835 RepID=UPI00163AAE3D|nr:hypothetical protein [Edaphobacter aggregans]
MHLDFVLRRQLEESWVAGCVFFAQSFIPRFLAARIALLERAPEPFAIFPCARSEPIETYTQNIRRARAAGTHNGSWLQKECRNPTSGGSGYNPGIQQCCLSSNSIA